MLFIDLVHHHGEGIMVMVTRGQHPRTSVYCVGVSRYTSRLVCSAHLYIFEYDAGR